MEIANTAASQLILVQTLHETRAIMHLTVKDMLPGKAIERMVNDEVSM